MKLKKDNKSKMVVNRHRSRRNKKERELEYRKNTSPTYNVPSENRKRQGESEGIE